ncbi:MAG: hypothetical protein PHN88_00325 [Ignavibacteria bacterium]|nr:hypothetical protein [Ignavibacteria bacterium]
MEISNLLGIKYKDVKFKFLIGNDIDDNIKSEILKSGLKYNVSLNNQDDVYSILEFSIPEKNYIKKYYFRNGFMISRIFYFTKEWKRIESAHFVYIVSDSSLINNYAINAVEKFFSNVCDVLQIDKRSLEKNKIRYVLCRDQDEIEKITGYKSLGMCDLAYDCVLSTFPCHYHELSHLLINYKLQNISLFTNPFLQEGFAVAMGGRGGREPYIIHNVGFFLAKSGFIDYKDLLNRQKFIGEDATISYPLSGLYNLFLIKTIGIDKYLVLYKKYSTDNSGINQSEINLTDLPSENSWNEFINDRFTPQGTFPAVNDEFENTILKTGNIIIGESQDFYKIGIKDTAFLKEENPQPGYFCTRFKELFPQKNYSGEKYAFVADSKEILIYNLYTNNLIADYTPSFSIPPVEIKSINGYYVFNITKNVFGKELNGLIVSR